jgi:hypothetical protein
VGAGFRDVDKALKAIVNDVTLNDISEEEEEVPEKYNPSSEPVVIRPMRIVDMVPMLDQGEVLDLINASENPILEEKVKPVKKFTTYTKSDIKVLIAGEPNGDERRRQDKK